MVTVHLKFSESDDIFDRNSQLVSAYKWIAAKRKEGFSCNYEGDQFYFETREEAVEFRLSIQ